MKNNPFVEISNWEQYHAGSDKFKQDQDERERERQENIERAWALRFENDTQDLF
tara:strand:- start:102 stop:263 length:162 start_codon:yes stop_codon:yes gene_type:complete